MTRHLPLLDAELEAHPYPLLFITISGAHLYGFPSPDSDFDLRGAHILPAREILGLLDKNDTIERSGSRDGVEIDLVTHDIQNFFERLLKRNGYVMEQLYSPLIVRTSPEHEELKRIAHNCLTRHHSHHYLGFAQTQWKLFEKESPRRVKPLLYVFRVLLTGIHLMRSGKVEANLIQLNEEFRLTYLLDLVARKLTGPEQSALEEDSIEFYSEEKDRLIMELEQAAMATHLPDKPSALAPLNALLLHLRLKSV